MIETIFSEEMRRDPFPFYDQCRLQRVLHLDPPGLWMIFDYDGVKKVLEDRATFSSAATPPGSTGKPFDWLIFKDPPRHSRLRSLIASAFTPRVIANLEPRIRQISRELLDAKIDCGELDLAVDYSIQLPLMVIAEMLGIPPAEYPLFRKWSDAILNLAETVTGSAAALHAVEEFRIATAEMDRYLQQVLSVRRQQPQDDLLSKLALVEIAGERLTHIEILGFFQLLLLAGSETTTNLINNALLCLLEQPDQLARLRRQTDLLASTIEEVLRYRSPLQAVFRKTTRAVELGGKTIPADQLVLPLIGAANRDPQRFERADRFDLTRSPNPHLAFGHGVHFCLGAALARLEARIALTDVLARMNDIEFASNQPWEPRAAFHVLGPVNLPLRFSGRPDPGIGQSAQHAMLGT
jgi:cytochrome P450